MRIIVISDTHCEQPQLPDGDILIHCGDLTYNGADSETKTALTWLSLQPHKHKLFIAGNHEMGWRNETSRYYKLRDFCPPLTYLHDSGIEINGLKLWGSPVQPWFYNWAFQKERGEQLREHWEQIPDDVDVLITHGPPKGFGDINKHDERFGDEDLLNRILVIKPKLHLFGHAHHGYGEYFHEGIHMINAAIMNEDYEPQNAPIVVDV